ncbi:UvrD-helicase domain-containing protein [Parapusillimonas sp. JC17]
MRRLRQRFAHIIIDEIQDMAGYDLDLLELMLRSNVRVTFVGDHRQATFATNNAPKNKAFRGPAIINKFEAWKKGLCCKNREA